MGADPLGAGSVQRTEVRRHSGQVQAQHVDGVLVFGAAGDQRRAELGGPGDCRDPPPDRGLSPRAGLFENLLEEHLGWAVGIEGRRDRADAEPAREVDQPVVDDGFCIVGHPVPVGGSSADGLISPLLDDRHRASLFTVLAHRHNRRPSRLVPRPPSCTTIATGATSALCIDAALYGGVIDGCCRFEGFRLTDTSDKQSLGQTSPL